MAKRYSKDFIILNKDLQSEKVVKKTYNNEFTEYWVYRDAKTNLIGLDGKRIGDGNFKLHCIIVCDYSDNHITKKTDKGLFVEGMRFTNEDLHEYLSKTSRS